MISSNGPVQVTLPAVKRKSPSLLVNANKIAFRRRARDEPRHKVRVAATRERAVVKLHQQPIRQARLATQNAMHGLCLRFASALNLPPGKSGRINKKKSYLLDVIKFRGGRAVLLVPGHMGWL